MARGGKREGAGRKPDPNSKRQQALARRAAKTAGLADTTEARGRGFTQADGTKAPDAPPNWPFGTQPPAAEAPAPAPVPPAEPGRVLTAREYLSQVVNSLELDEKTRIDAAKKLIEFEEAKPAPMGKKDAKAAEAKKASGGRFGASKAPLALVKR